MGKEDSVAAVRDKVQRYLLEVLNRVEVDRDGDFTFQHGSSRIFISVKAVGESSTSVRITAPIVFEAPATPELFKYVATGNTYRYGHMSCKEEDGKVSIYFSHSLLGDYLDPEELKLATFLLARTADEIDDEIVAKFGGKRFHED